MGDEIRDKCGLIFGGLKKPEEYFDEKYGRRYLLGLHKIGLTKLRNRGQHSAGFGQVNFGLPEYERYTWLERELGPNPETKLFASIDDAIRLAEPNGQKSTIFTGPISLSHVRWSTQGSESRPVERAHPVERKGMKSIDRWLLAMNGNFANNADQREFLKQVAAIRLTSTSDMDLLVDQFGHFAGEEWERKHRAGCTHDEIDMEFDVLEVLKNVYDRLDGGFVISGLIGNGDAFVMRDPNGIRPLFFYENDELIFAASESSPIKTTLGLLDKDIQTLGRGQAIIYKHGGEVGIERFAPERSCRACHFEPVYFRKDSSLFRRRSVTSWRVRLGAELADRVYAAWEKHDPKDVVFMPVPNSGNSGALGMVEAMRGIQKAKRVEMLLERFTAMDESSSVSSPTFDEIMEILSGSLTTGMALKKDRMIRTYTLEAHLKEAAAIMAYDVAEDYVRDKVVFLVDDSVVQGNTVQNALAPLMIHNGAKEIYVVSTEPLIKFPCSGGVMMSIIQSFIAYKAAMALAEEEGKMGEVDELVRKAEQQEAEYIAACREVNAAGKPLNSVDFRFDPYLEQVYDLFGDEKLIGKVGELYIPEPLRKEWKGRVHAIFQTNEGLERALGGSGLCMGCTTGKQPTQGGYRANLKALSNAHRHLDVLPY